MEFSSHVRREVRHSGFSTWVICAEAGAGAGAELRRC